MTINLLQELSLKLGLGRRDLLHIISTAPKRYKVYQIPKRRRGTRTIAQPSRELKAIQRYLLENVLSKLPVHAAATGYVEGRNITQNAASHVGSRVIMKLDFENFFPSITVHDWELYAKANNVGLESTDLTLCNYILFWGQRSNVPQCLSIGAPTSPILSNVLLFEIDTRLAEAAAAANVVYTRYADDITASGETIEDVQKFEVAARAVIRATQSPRLIFNDEKRGIYTSGQRRMVTGLVVTPDGKVSIGRERKRLISAMLHRSTVNKLDPDNLALLKGLLGFCLAAEADFVSRLRNKYGDAAIDKALRYHIPRKGAPTRPRR